MRLVRVSLVISVALVLLFGLSLLVTLHPAQAASEATIQSLIDAAPNGGTVNIPAGTYTESLTVNKTLTLTGVSGATTIIKAVTGQRVISVTEGNDLRLENLTVTGGHSIGDVGGGVYVISGNLTLNNCRVANNSADLGGGVFRYGPSGRVDVINSRIESNTSLADGGGLFVINGRLTLTNAQIVSNTASGNGGGLFVINGEVTSASTQVISNTANGGAGGGLVVLGGGITSTNAQILSNTASSDGGGLLVEAGNVDMSGGLVSNNRSLYGNGGGLLQADDAYTVTLTNTRFERNAAHYTGGGATVSGTLIISHSTFATNTVDSGNITDTYGGGVYVEGFSQILASTFVSNSARCTACFNSSGGGAYTLAPATIQDSTFDRNAASIGGGVFSPIITVTRSIFKNNTASDGGAIHAFMIQTAGSSFLNNQAVNSGGGLWSILTTLSSTQFISNTAGSLGGGGVWALGNLDAVNVLFADNQASGAGAAINTGNASLRHVTIAGATLRAMPAIRVSGGIVSITDTIVSSYTVGISQTDGLLNADYNLFFTATPTQTSGVTVTWGTHNLSGDPKFVNPAAGNYHLALGSPAIDSGTNAGVTIDLAGLSRPRGKDFDMGAYEFQPPVYLPLIRR